jgi:hypothetical protein
VFHVYVLVEQTAYAVLGVFRSIDGAAMEILRTGADPLLLLDGSLCTTDKLHQALSEQPVVTIMGSHPEHSSAPETIFRIERHFFGI